jgi:hypothetical protein
MLNMQVEDEMRTMIEMAREVSDKHTFWNEAQLLRPSVSRLMTRNRLLTGILSQFCGKNVEANLPPLSDVEILEVENK